MATPSSLTLLRPPFPSSEEPRTTTSSAPTMPRRASRSRLRAARSIDDDDDDDDEEDEAAVLTPSIGGGGRAAEDDEDEDDDVDDDDGPPFCLGCVWAVSHISQAVSRALLTKVHERHAHVSISQRDVCKRGSRDRWRACCSQPSSRTRSRARSLARLPIRCVSKGPPPRCSRAVCAPAPRIHPVLKSPI